jgi:hypothetical protein
MKYDNMTPEKHLAFMFRAKIEPTGERTYKQEDLFTYNSLQYGQNMPHDMPVRVENVMSVKMAETDYNNFIESYGKYLDLLYAVETDPIAKDMFEQLVIYITLKM